MAMKTRVKFYCGRYYPEVRRYGFWFYTYEGDNIVQFASKEAAIQWLKTDFMYNNKVVWKSDDANSNPTN